MWLVPRHVLTHLQVSPHWLLCLSLCHIFLCDLFPSSLLRCGFSDTCLIWAAFPGAAPGSRLLGAKEVPWQWKVPVPPQRRKGRRLVLALRVAVKSSEAGLIPISWGFLISGGREGAAGTDFLFFFHNDACRNIQFRNSRCCGFSSH